MRWHSRAHELRLGQGVDDINLAVAGRDDEAGTAGHAGIRVAEEIEREERERQPDQENEDGHGDHGGADECAEQSNNGQQNHERQRDHQHLERGIPRFSGMFHQGKIVTKRRASKWKVRG